jgi:hypothetical protein
MASPSPPAAAVLVLELPRPSPPAVKPKPANFDFRGVRVAIASDPGNAGLFGNVGRNRAALGPGGIIGHFSCGEIFASQRAEARRGLLRRP